MNRGQAASFWFADQVRDTVDVENLEDGIHELDGGSDSSRAYRNVWEDEALEDAVYSATGVRSEGDASYQTLTATRQQVWRRFPSEHFGTILEVGCGYGRVAMLLSCERRVTCERYIGIDISHSMLVQCAEYRKKFGVFDGARFLLLRGSAEEINLPASSVDLVVSSGVFLHMGKEYVRATLQRIAAALRPGGIIVFDTSFPNARAVASLPVRIYGALAPSRPHRMKYYSRAELASLLTDTGIASKCPDYRVEAAVYSLFPDRFRGTRIPAVGRINQLLTPPPRFLRAPMTLMFSVYSGALDGI